MKTIWSNATVRWSEPEIERRDALIREVPALLGAAWRGLNPRVRLERVETPVLTPSEHLQGHIESGFDLLPAGKMQASIKNCGPLFLRPETTAGTFEAFRQDWPMQNQWPKVLPLCYWQAGKSFRDEKNPDTMRATKLRLREFWQMEFQLFCLPGTKADYIGSALTALVARYGGAVQEATELPHYSTRTVDWMMDELEVAGCSVRTDFEGLEVHEVAIGLDRLVAVMGR